MGLRIVFPPGQNQHRLTRTSAVPLLRTERLDLVQQPQSSTKAIASLLFQCHRISPHSPTRSEPTPYCGTVFHESLQVVPYFLQETHPADLIFSAAAFLMLTERLRVLLNRLVPVI